MKFLLRLVAALGFVAASALAASVAIAQTQAILPNGMTQFTDGNGAPYAGGHVFMYVPFTTTPKTTYQDPLGVTPNQNPIALDANGRAIIWGNGEYRQIVQDLYGNVVWDQLTYAAPASSAGGSGGVIWYGTATGTANAITLATPAGFVATDGQTVGFIANATNTASTTINASGYGSVLLEKNASAGPVVLTGGEIAAGNLEFATYSASLNSFILQALLPTPGIGAQTVIAAAATTDLGSVTTHDVIVSGTTTVTSFGASATTQWPLYLVQFASVTPITESAALLTPTRLSITTAVGDTAWALYLGTGNWQIIQYNSTAPSTVVTMPQFRLSTSASDPISPRSGTGVGTVFAQPDGGNSIPLWNGTTFVATACGAMSNVLANSATGNAGPAAAVAASVYDLVAWNNAGACTLTRDVAWTNVTTPAAGDAFTRVSGVLVNSVAIANGPGAGYGTLLGTIATDAGGATVTFNPLPTAASTGPTGGAWVGLWSEYDRIPVGLVEQDSNTSWVYGNSLWRASDNSNNNRLTIVTGQAADAISVAFINSISSTSAQAGTIGIGYNSASLPVTLSSTGTNGGTNGSTSGAEATALYETTPAIGVSYFQALEKGSGSGTITYYGSTALYAVNAQYHELSARWTY